MRTEPNLAEARTQAAKILEAAWDESRGYSYPNQHVYPHLWLWDSCFHAIAWATLDDERAVRELEAVDFLFELEMDYGAYREYRRHRMQTCIPQPLTVREGHIVPPLVVEAGAEEAFQQAMQASASAYEQLLAVSQPAASMVATHAHVIRTLAKLNLREGYHLLKLRTAKQAHFTIREVALQMLAELERVHPRLIKYANLRERSE